MESLETVEVCPSCGNFVDRLVQRTGWCANCSRTDKGERRCVQCGDIYRDRYHLKCGRCRRKNAKGTPALCVGCGKPYIRRNRAKYCEECKFISCAFCGERRRTYPSENIYTIPSCIKCRAKAKKAQQILRQYDVSEHEVIKWLKKQYHYPSHWKLK